MKFAIGWEMFDETQQSSIDAWASHKISLEELLVKTDFQNRWGIYSSVYEQILRTTEKAKVRNLALNAPSELARKIARAEPLTAKEMAMLPSGFVADAGAYKNFVALIGEHPYSTVANFAVHRLPESSLRGRRLRSIRTFWTPPCRACLTTASGSDRRCV